MSEEREESVDHLFLHCYQHTVVAVSLEFSGNQMGNARYYLSIGKVFQSRSRQNGTQYQKSYGGVLGKRETKMFIKTKELSLEDQVRLHFVDIFLV